MLALPAPMTWFLAVHQPALPVLLPSSYATGPHSPNDDSTVAMPTPLLSPHPDFSAHNHRGSFHSTHGTLESLGCTALGCCLPAGEAGESCAMSGDSDGSAFAIPLSESSIGPFGDVPASFIRLDWRLGAMCHCYPA